MIEKINPTIPIPITSSPIPDEQREIIMAKSSIAIPNPIFFIVNPPLQISICLILLSKSLEKSVLPRILAVLFSFVSLAFSLNRGEQGKYLIPPKPLYPAVVRKNALPPITINLDRKDGQPVRLSFPKLQ